MRPGRFRKKSDVILPRPEIVYRGACNRRKRDVAEGKDAVHLGRLAGDRARHRIARGARRRECDDRGQDRRAASQAAGYDLQRGRGDRGRRREGAAGDLRHPRRRTGGRGGREDRRDIRRHRYLHQQCKRHPAYRHAADRHEAVRSDAPDQHARDVSRLQIMYSASEVGAKSSHSESGAASRHGSQVVQEPRRLHDGQVRHVDVHARHERRVRPGWHRGQFAVAADGDRHGGGAQPARRRNGGLDQPFAGDHGRCRA